MKLPRRTSEPSPEAELRRRVEAAGGSLRSSAEDLFRLFNVSPADAAALSELQAALERQGLKASRPEPRARSDEVGGDMAVRRGDSSEAPVDEFRDGNALDHRVCELSEWLRVVQAELAETRERADDLQVALDHAGAHGEQATERGNALDQRVRELREALDQAQSESISARSELEQAGHRISGLEQSLEEAWAEAAEAVEARRAALEAAATSRAELERAGEELGGYGSRIDEAHDRERTATEVASRRAELEDLDDRIAQAKTILAEVHDAIEREREERAVVVATAAPLENAAAAPDGNEVAEVREADNARRAAEAAAAESAREGSDVDREQERDEERTRSAESRGERKWFRRAGPRAFLDKPGACDVCGREIHPDTEEELQDSGWIVQGDTGLCDRCQQDGWQFPTEVAVPFRRAAEGD